MTNSSGNPSIGGVAREIQERLQRAQASRARAGAAGPGTGLGVTKDGRLVAPGETDESIVTSIPDATFHARGTP